MAPQLGLLLVGEADGLLLQLLDAGHVEGDLHAGAWVDLTVKDAAHGDKVAVGEALIHRFGDAERDFLLRGLIAQASVGISPLRVVLALLVDAAQADEFGELVLSAQGRAENGDKLRRLVGGDSIVVSGLF